MTKRWLLLVLLLLRVKSQPNAVSAINGIGLLNRSINGRGCQKVLTVTVTAFVANPLDFSCGGAEEIPRGRGVHVGWNGVVWTRPFAAVLKHAQGWLRRTTTIPKHALSKQTKHNKCHIKLSPAIWYLLRRRQSAEFFFPGYLVVEIEFESDAASQLGEVVLLVALRLAGGRAEEQRPRNGVVLGSEVVAKRCVVVVFVGEELRREPKLAVVQVVSHGSNKTQTNEIWIWISEKFESVNEESEGKEKERERKKERERMDLWESWVCNRTEAFPFKYTLSRTDSETVYVFFL